MRRCGRCGSSPSAAARERPRRSRRRSSVATTSSGCSRSVPRDGPRAAARLVSIVGQAGIGKSRLAWELEKYLDGVVETVWWHSGRSPAYGEGITFWALGEMVRRRAGLAERDDEVTTGRASTAMVEEHVPDADERRWIEPRSWPCSVGRDRGRAPGGRERAVRRLAHFFERIAAEGTGGARVRGPALGRRRARSTSSITSSSGRAIADLHRHARPAGALERRPGLGAGPRSVTRLHLEPLTDERHARAVTGLVPGLPESVVARDRSPAPTASRSTRSRRSGCSSPTGRLEPAATAPTAHARPRRARVPDDAARPDRGAPRRACSRPTARCSRTRGPRPELHASRRWRRCSAEAAELDVALAHARPARAAERRDRPACARTAASTRSSRPWSAKWPTRPSPDAIARRGTSPPRATSSRWTDEELAGVLASTTTPRGWPRRPAMKLRHHRAGAVAYRAAADRERASTRTRPRPVPGAGDGAVQRRPGMRRARRARRRPRLARRRQAKRGSSTVGRARTTEAWGTPGRSWASSPRPRRAVSEGQPREAISLLEEAARRLAGAIDEATMASRRPGTAGRATSWS